MAYKQNNPLSRKSSSPLFRKQGVSPINNRRLDPKLDPNKNSISRKSSSPLNAYPTSGTFAGSVEEAETAHAPGANEQYVNIGTEEAPIWDMQTSLGDIHFGSSVSGYGTDDQKVNFPYYKSRKTDSNPDAAYHPLGLANHNYRSEVLPVYNNRPETSMYPLRAKSNFGGTSTDVLSDLDLDWGQLDEHIKPSVNPFKVGSIGGSTHDMGTPGINWNQSGYTSGNYYDGDNVTDDARNTPWKFASEQFGDGSGPNLAQEGMTTVGYEGSPAIYPFFSNLSQNRAGNVTDEARGENRLLTKNFNSLPRGITNRANVRDAFSTYVNRNTMSPGELFSWDRSAARPGTSFGFSDQFKTQYPEMLAGGQYGSSGPDTYDLDNNMFRNALSSSKFTGNTSGMTNRLGNALRAEVDNPVDLMTKMVNDGNMSRQQAQQYLAALRANTYSGRIE